MLAAIPSVSEVSATSRCAILASTVTCHDIACATNLHTIIIRADDSTDAVYLSDVFILYKFSLSLIQIMLNADEVTDLGAVSNLDTVMNANRVLHGELSYRFPGTHKALVVVKGRR